MSELSAFPHGDIIDYDNGLLSPAQGGMSQRAYFAAHALQGITANPSFFGPMFQQSPISAAEFAVECADELIKKLAASAAELEGNKP